MVKIYLRNKQDGNLVFIGSSYKDLSAKSGLSAKLIKLSHKLTAQELEIINNHQVSTVKPTKYVIHHKDGTKTNVSTLSEAATVLKVHKSAAFKIFHDMSDFEGVKIIKNLQ